MTAFRDFYDLVEPLVLPIRGKDYEIPPASASRVLRYRNFMGKVEAGQPVEPHERVLDEEYFEIFLGSALVQMREDGIHPGAIEHAANTAMIDTIGGREAAEIAWNSRDPKAAIPVPIQVPETASTPSPSTDEATTTS
ncbi:hypothetical protein ACIPEQ_13335 [Curtobacterium sp. NPDC087080]|uniref:DUF7426 family protein n=1 Tax=Curtobacterium sp. NPDC087080 TaxID=3363965 RepID=UPI00382A5FA0